MADSFEEQEWVRTGVAAAMLRSFDKESREALQDVATLLNSILPKRTKLEYTGLFTKKLAKVSVTIADDALALELDSHGSLLATRVHTNRGIVLKREEWPIDQWVATLVTSLEEKAGQDAEARKALAEWLGRSI